MVFITDMILAAVATGGYIVCAALVTLVVAIVTRIIAAIISDLTTAVVAQVVCIVTVSVGALIDSTFFSVTGMILVLVLVAKSRRQLCAANGTILGSRTGSIRAGGVAVGSNFICSVGVAAVTGICGVALFRAGGVSYDGIVAMALGSNRLLGD